FLNCSRLASISTFFCKKSAYRSRTRASVKTVYHPSPDESAWRGSDRVDRIHGLSEGPRLQRSVPMDILRELVQQKLTQLVQQKDFFAILFGFSAFVMSLATLLLRPLNPYNPWLKIEVFAKMPHSIARDLQLGALPVFEPNHHAAAKPRSHFFDVLYVKQRCAMNADELRRIELLLELRDGALD